MIDEAEVLKQAMHNVAMRQFMAELREAVVFGPKILGDVYAEYMKLMDVKKDTDDNKGES